MSQQAELSRIFQIAFDRLDDSDFFYTGDMKIFVFLFCVSASSPDEYNVCELTANQTFNISYSTHFTYSVFFG